MAHAHGRASWDKKPLVNPDSTPLANSLPLTRWHVNHSGPPPASSLSTVELQESVCPLVSADCILHPEAGPGRSVT